jgi:uncharacterized protein with HEPN domain
MSKIDDRTRLLHMRDAAREAVSFVRNGQREDLDNNRMLTLAIVKEIEIIGEAASRVSGECKAKYPQLMWTQMVGMRNRLTHAYFEVDLDIVWEVVTQDLPPLIDELEAIIALET